VRIALPVWNQRVSPLLDAASQLHVVESGVIETPSSFDLRLTDKTISRRCMVVRSLQIDVVICGGVSEPFQKELEASGVRVVSGIAGPVDDVIEAFFLGALDQPRFRLPGGRPPGESVQEKETRPKDRD
jgi:predicted Fe-Mo cluster-binding NifX family protein